MSIRQISAEGLRDMFAQNTDAAVFALLTFTHPSLSTPERIANNTEAITYDGHEYMGFPFKFTPPAEDEEREAVATARVSNVDRRLAEVLRQIQGLAGVDIQVVRWKQGAVTREMHIPGMYLMSADIDTETASLQISHAFDILNEPATQDILNPGTAPGLFR
ncbi:DUF1833 domain-containing protein [Halomonas eurihalina]|uniref:DUF1833 domain-containing protein n=1 Tax=Halomonas eurihalina TaxID=42566 RepID=A0A5D9D9K2_HALER|nr:DUF1833 family protein [Halomonas eurihalina]MDR5859396.1 DUF1833 family protein [Halomonas eurihalina]TZG40564.1 DUF1833 domain-containing protein [Halomonas eurihalina]